MPFIDELDASQKEAEEVNCPRCDCEMQHVDEPVEDMYSPSGFYGHSQRTGNPYHICPECGHIIEDE